MEVLKRTEYLNILLNNVFTILFAEASKDQQTDLYSKGKEFIIHTANKLDPTDQKTEATVDALFNEWVKKDNHAIQTTHLLTPNYLISILIALLFDLKKIQDSSRTMLTGFCKKYGINGKRLRFVLDNKERIKANKSLPKRITIINKLLSPRYSLKIMDAPEPKPLLYIANQISPEGFDEVQRLIFCHNLGIHTALSGPPGVGKTQSVEFISAILNRELYTKICSTRTTESHIISYPVLDVKKGASITKYKNGPLLSAMIDPGIFYGDEFNLLKEDVQKRLNSAFDARSAIDRNDNKLIHAQPGFWAVISYNPKPDLTSRDLDDSVADRFVHINYDRWKPEFKSIVSLANARDDSGSVLTLCENYNIDLQMRGYTHPNRFYYGVGNLNDITWKDFFTWETVSETPDYIYYVYDPKRTFDPENKEWRDQINKLDKKTISDTELAQLLSRFTEMMYSLSKYGTSPLIGELGLSGLFVNQKVQEDMELFSIHESSIRIESSALMHYFYLLQLDCKPYLAQALAARIVIDQLCYGQYRYKKLQNKIIEDSSSTLSVYDLTTIIAKQLDLLKSTEKVNTNFY